MCVHSPATDGLVYVTIAFSIECFQKEMRIDIKTNTCPFLNVTSSIEIDFIFHLLCWKTLLVVKHQCLHTFLYFFLIWQFNQQCFKRLFILTDIMSVHIKDLLLVYSIESPYSGVLLVGCKMRERPSVLYLWTKSKLKWGLLFLYFYFPPLVLYIIILPWSVLSYCSLLLQERRTRAHGRW